MVVEKKESVAPTIPAKRKPGERGPEIPLFTKVKARNLYLNECLPYATIADRTGIPLRTLQAMAQKEGWTVVRRNRKAELIAKSDAERAEMDAEIVQAIASESEELAMGAIRAAKDELQNGGDFAAKNFQAWSAGAKNFVSIARMMRDPSANGQEASGVVNLFLVRAGDVIKEPKQVTEIHATPSK